MVIEVRLKYPPEMVMHHANADHIAEIGSFICVFEGKSEFKYLSENVWLIIKNGEVDEGGE